MLERLSGQTRTLQAGNKKSRKLPDFESIRSSASSVFIGLQRALQISCSDPHRVSMYLKPSVEGDAYLDEKTTATPEEQAFRVVLHHEVAHPKQKAARWSIEEAEIKLLGTILPISVATHTHTIVTSTTCSTAFVGTQTRTVTFAEPEPPSVPATIPVIHPQHSLTEIHDLCQSIHSMATMQCGKCLGYVMAGRHRHGLYSPKIRLIDRSSLSIESLAGILDQSHRSTLTGADARRLAVPLA